MSCSSPPARVRSSAAQRTGRTRRPAATCVDRQQRQSLSPADRVRTTLDSCRVRGPRGWRGVRFGALATLQLADCGAHLPTDDDEQRQLLDSAATEITHTPIIHEVIADEKTIIMYLCESHTQHSLRAVISVVFLFVLSRVCAVRGESIFPIMCTDARNPRCRRVIHIACTPNIMYCTHTHTHMHTCTTLNTRPDKCPASQPAHVHQTDIIVRAVRSR